ncbi:MAG: PD40 domain-containing protein, partial [Phycisphaerae bacterium]|nr:PD40 domain-containing protein [Phycisphaerae bacterium]
MRTCRSVVCALAVFGLSSVVSAQGGSRPSAKMLQQPDVSAKDIVFVYANDLWLVGRDGGMARPVASPPGRESFPKFSPDGKFIAFVGNYEGNRDVYVIPVEGGVSTRLTYHPSNEVITDWTPDGRVMYFASGQGGLQRQEQLFTIASTGGPPARLPVPYGAMGTISPDGSWLAYTPSTTDFRTWKRYRGG